MFAMSTVPPDGNGVVVSEADMVPVHFVSYDQTGRVISTYSEVRYFFHRRLSLGETIVMGEGNPLTHYIEFVGDARAPVLRVRPAFTEGFDKTEVAPREAATLADLPAATVSFEGAMKGTHRHPGGDLLIGWTLPGTYTVRIEAFPYLPAEFTLTVGDAS